LDFSRDSFGFSLEFLEIWGLCGIFGTAISWIFFLIPNRNSISLFGNVLLLRNALGEGGVWTLLQNLTLQKAFVGFCVTKGREGVKNTRIQRYLIQERSNFDFNFQLDMLLVHPKSSVMWNNNYNAPEKLEIPGYPVNSPRASRVQHLISGAFHFFLANHEAHLFSGFSIFIAILCTAVIIIKRVSIFFFFQ
jgi:hypothetical protein